MNQAKPILMVALQNGDAFVRVAGRASFMVSPNFKMLLVGLFDRGCRRFVIDLTACQTMDSCFLGVTVGIGKQLINSPAGARIELLNANSRVTDLIDSLGATHLFQFPRGSTIPEQEFSDALPSSASPDKRELSQTSLDAHHELIALHADNAAKFKDVVRFLAEDLKKTSV